MIKTCSHCDLNVDTEKLGSDEAYWKYKAPEGATHFDPNGFVFDPCVHWWREDPTDNRKWQAWSLVTSSWLGVVETTEFVAKPGSVEVA